MKPGDFELVSDESEEADTTAGAVGGPRGAAGAAGASSRLTRVAGRAAPRAGGLLPVSPHEDEPQHSGAPALVSLCQQV